MPSSLSVRGTIARCSASNRNWLLHHPTDLWPTQQRICVRPVPVCLTAFDMCQIDDLYFPQLPGSKARLCRCFKLKHKTYEDVRKVHSRPKFGTRRRTVSTDLGRAADPNDCIIIEVQRSDSSARG